VKPVEDGTISAVWLAAEQRDERLYKAKESHRINSFWHTQQSDYASSKDGFVSHLTYLLQPSYLGKISRDRNGKF